ncbi:MAG: hypothetical protein FWG44_00905 [Oscillospiraceae bacterium]|nr:hypothetical protein [Oscillospiraceae bacterium]
MNENIQVIENAQISAIMSAGMKLLRENLGLIECELFVSNISQNRFDYTKWRENLYEDMSLDELLDSAATYMKEHPELVPKNAKII